MSLRAYSNHFLMLRNHTGMVVPRAFHSRWRLLALDQIQLYAYFTGIKRRFNILCSDLNFPFCICCLFGRFSVLSFLCVTAPNHSRRMSYIILQKDVICWSMGPLKWVVSKKESSWSKFVHVVISLPLSLLGKSPGRCRSAMAPWTLWECSWFITPSFDLHTPVGELRRLHQRPLWIRNPRKLLNSLPQSHVVAGYISKSFPFEKVWWEIFYSVSTGFA